MHIEIICISFAHRSLEEFSRTFIGRMSSESFGTHEEGILNIEVLLLVHIHISQEIVDLLLHWIYLHSDLLKQINI